MNSKIKNYVELLFEEAPKTKKAFELKEELLTNLNDKYNDLCERGEDEKTAYDLVISSIGDIDQLISELKMNDAMSYETKQKERKKSAMMVSVAIGLYILSAMWVIVFSEVFGQEIIGISLMLTTCAIATGLLIYNGMTRPKYIKQDETLVEEFKEWQSNSRDTNAIRKTIQSTMWTLIVAIYLIISFMYGIWGYSWIIFIVGAALENIIKLVFQLREER